MKTYYSPGCGVLEYKPELTKKVEAFLKKEGKIEESYLTCCWDKPAFEEPVMVINTCPGCDKRFRTWYDNTETITLWEVLLDCDFDYPDYGGIEMAIHDSCDTKHLPQVLDAVREILRRMNIKVAEPKNTRENATCCGESYRSGGASPDEVRAVSAARAASMPTKDVAVYCTGCASYMALGGATPHHLLDLLFDEETTIKAPEL